MRNFLCFLLFVLPLVFVACEDNVKTQEDITTLSRLSNAEESFLAEGGAGEIRYKLTNAADPTLLEAQCEAAWIENITTGDVITYNVAKNEDATERTATIVVSYNDLSFDVVVRQSGSAAVTIEGWAIVGSMTNNWDLGSAIAMTTEGDYFAAKGVNLTTNDAFKFVKDGSYEVSRGGQGYLAEANHYYTATRSGSDVRVKEAGSYDIYLNSALDTYYIMTVGVSPDEAEDGNPEQPEDPDNPTNTTWSIAGDFVDNSWSEQLSFRRNIDYATVEDVAFANTDGRGLVFKLYRNGGESDEDIYGVADGVVCSLDTPIVPKSITAGGSSDIVIEADAEMLYDIFFDINNLKLWVVPDGEYPTMDAKWTSAEGILFSTKNYGVSLMSRSLNIYLDFKSSATSDGTIPEGTYYANSEIANGNEFNAEGCLIDIQGLETHVLDGELTVTHISGGYRLDIEILSTHMHRIKVRYEGPLAENPMMGRPITNPE